MFLSGSESRSLHSVYAHSLLTSCPDQKEALVLIKLLLRDPVLVEEVSTKRQWQLMS
jgi:hypothetical protein